MEYKVYGTIGKDYKIVDVVDTCRQNARYTAEELNKGFRTIQTVNAEWEQLFYKYRFLWNRLNEAGKFKEWDDTGGVYPDCNGYDICLNSLFSFGNVLLTEDDYIVGIHYLNEEQFEKVVEYMQICVEAMELDKNKQEGN